MWEGTSFALHPNVANAPTSTVDLHSSFFKCGILCVRLVRDRKETEKNHEDIALDLTRRGTVTR